MAEQQQQQVRRRLLLLLEECATCKHLSLVAKAALAASLVGGRQALHQHQLFLSLSLALRASS